MNKFMKKKLIEVSLPLEAINREAAREKSIRHGHPSTLHLWWARRPLAACRAVLFASLVDDPSSLPEQFPTEEEQQRERRRLHNIIEELVKWENSNNETVLAKARAEIMRSTNNNPPPVYDPFAGGGSIPLEAQRLGLEAHASDLNPVAVLINKALIEIPPKFAGQPPVNPESREKLDHTKSWKGAQGLAEDVRYYGKWMRDEAERRIGHLYPKVKAVQTDDGSFRHATDEEIQNPKSKIQNLTVIAWLWARTVKCPNPTCGAMMPLVRSFALSTKKGKETHVSPIIDHENKTIRFEIQTAKSKIQNQTGTVDRRGARCLVCETLAPLDHVRAEGKAGRMAAQMMAIVAEGNRGRIYLAPNAEQASIAAQAEPTWKPDAVLPLKHRNFQTPGYGMTNVGDLFTNRQLVALVSFNDLVGEAREKILKDTEKTEIENAESYANALATYLAFACDKVAEGSTVICTWSALPSKLHVVGTFGRQAIPMTWDYAESNVFNTSAGNFERMTQLISRVIEKQGAISDSQGKVEQLDAANLNGSSKPLFSTDPPYYDNIAYADLSDFVYVWLKRSLGNIYPELFGTLLVPKKQELIAAPHRFEGDDAKAKEFFETGLQQVFRRMREAQNKDYPITVYYAFKQTENDGDEKDSNGNQTVTASTGWETMLEGLINSGFAITGTIPMRTERAGGFRNFQQNALASSIVLVCRPRPEDTEAATRGEFLRSLKRELPDALRKLQESNIAPVDLAQASIGPGMAVYSRYSRVVESDGSPMKVRAALGIINQILDEVLAEQDSEYDSETRWAIDWFAQFGMNAGAYGDAETLSKAKNTSVAGMEASGIISSRAGRVKLLSREELNPNWNPDTDNRLTILEITQHLIRTLETQGEQAAAKILNSEAVGYQGDIAKDLAYRLYNFCERKGWAQEALAYNSLIVSWNDVQKQAAEQARNKEATQSAFDFE
jgi:putative DNA methylase